MSDDKKKDNDPSSNENTAEAEVNKKTREIKMAALEKLANPTNQGMLDAIKRLTDQQTKLPEMYSGKGMFPKIAELLKNHQQEINQSSLKSIIDQQNRISDQFKKAISSPLKDLEKSLSGIGLQDLNPPNPISRPSGIVNDEIFKTIEKSRQREIAQKKKERQEEQKVNAAILNQEKYLADLVQSNMLLQQSVTALLNHTVTFEEKKEVGSARQYQVSLWAFWAAILSTLIALLSAGYTIYFQPPVQINVPPAKIEAPVVNVDTKSIVDALGEQTRILKKIEKKADSQKPKEPTKKTD